MTPVALDLRAQARVRLPAVPDMPELREAALGTWRGRMINEYSSSRVFEALAAQLEAAGLDPAIVAACKVFADEERKHGVLCGSVVEALGGEARAHWREEHAFPLHEDAATPIEGALRNVLSVSCLSETIAVSLIGAEREEMPDGELRELLTEIWADEVGHARFGWRLVERLAPSLDDATRARLGDYLAVALAHLEEHELAHLPLSSNPPPEGACLGLCSGPDARALFYDTVEHVIVPGLERHGLPAWRAWNARHAGARTLERSESPDAPPTT
jgi:hypothetical protein